MFSDDSSFVKVLKIIGVVLDIFSFITGISGLPGIIRAIREGSFSYDYSLIRFGAFSQMDIVARFFIFLFVIVFFVFLLILTGRTVARISGFWSGITGLLAPYVYIGLLSAFSLVMSIMWSSEIHIALRLFLYVGFWIPIPFMVAHSTPWMEYEFLPAVIFAFLITPAQLLTLFILFNIDPGSNAFGWILGLVGIPTVCLNTWILKSTDRHFYSL